MSGDDDEFCSEEEKEESKKKNFPVIKSYTDIQRLKLEKLMANPEKPVSQPTRITLFETVSNDIRFEFHPGQWIVR